MDESCTLMLLVRARKTSIERKPKVKGWGSRSRSGMWERQAERMLGSHAGSAHSDGEAEGTAELREVLQTKQERRRWKRTRERVED